MNARCLINLVTLLVLQPIFAFAQEDSLRELLTEHQVGECPEFILNAEFLIPRLNDEAKFDSVYLLLDYVEDRCGPEYFADYRMLHGIEMGDYPGDLCDTYVLDEILMATRCIEDFMADDAATDLGEFTPYRTFLRNLAASLLDRTDTSSIAHLVCRYYSGDCEFVFSRLRRQAYQGTCLQKDYDREINAIGEQIKALRAHAAAGIGIWIPFGNAELLGNKVEIGLEIGARRHRFGFDLVGAVRLLESRDYYVYYYNERLVPTKRFVGGYIGGSLIGELISQKRYGLELFAGGGYDGFQALGGEEDYKAVNSYNVNFGFTAKYFYNRQRNRYFGIQARYNIVDYDTNGGTDLSGNTVSVKIFYGFQGNLEVRGRARDLHYFD